MRYVSLFSGIEAASAAWEPLGWEPMAFSEIEAFPCAVLKERFPYVPNLGDVKEVDWRGFEKAHGRPDVVVGGSPCQSFSVAGTRTGLDGPSGLMWEYVRAIRELRPAWLLWENVPGALSSSHGEDFRCLLESLDALGYGLAWRVLDAQFFGVAQRRERVFLVGRLGDVERPCQVLFEPESLRWDPPSSREKRKELAAGAGSGAACTGFCTGNTAGAGSIGYQEELSPTLRGGASGTNMAPTVLEIQGSAIDRAPENGPAGPGVCYPDDNGAYSFTARDRHAVYQIAGNVIGREEKNGGHQLGVVDPDDHGAFTLNTADRHGVAVIDLTGGDAQSHRVYSVDGISPTLRSHDSGGSDSVKVLCSSNHHAVAFAQNTRDEACLLNGDGSVAGALAANPGMKQTAYIKDADSIRRLTPRECERLQGFPDDWTLIPYRGKPAEECPDTPRYKALGNSMAVPVMRWIGERIEAVEES